MDGLEDDPGVVRERRDEGGVRDAPAAGRPRPALAGKIDHAAELARRGRFEVTFDAGKRATRAPDLIRRHPGLARAAERARDIAVADGAQHLTTRLFGKRRE